MLSNSVKGALLGEGPFAGKIYFFKGDQYWRYDLRKDYGEIDYPRPLKDWKLPKEFETGIDACLPGENQYAGKAYFFRGPWWVSYEWKTGRVGDKKPLFDWGRGRFPFPNGVDASLAGAGKPFKGKAYFFKGAKYARYDWGEDKFDFVDADTSLWQLGERFASNIDSCVSAVEGSWPAKDIAYFFKGSEYVKFDWSAQRAFEGYPISIAAAWPTGCAVWASHSQAPTGVGDPRLDGGKNRVAAYPYGSLGGQAGWQASVEFTTIKELANKLSALTIPPWYGDDQAGKDLVPRGRITRLAINGHGSGGLFKVNGEYAQRTESRYTVANPEDLTEDNIRTDADLNHDLKRIAALLAPGASLLLMGCQVAQTQVGGYFVMTMSEIFAGHTVTGLTTIGQAGERGSKRGAYSQPGMRDTDQLKHAEAKEEGERVAKYWGDLKAWPWAWEYSPRAKTALNGVIIKHPETDNR